MTPRPRSSSGIHTNLTTGTVLGLSRVPATKTIIRTGLTKHAVQRSCLCAKWSLCSNIEYLARIVTFVFLPSSFYSILVINFNVASFHYTCRWKTFTSTLNVKSARYGGWFMPCRINVFRGENAKGRHAKTRQKVILSGFRMATFRLARQRYDKQ